MSLNTISIGELVKGNSPKSKIGKIRYKYAKFCQEIHNLVRGIYIKYTFYYRCINGLWANPKTNQLIYPNTRKEIDKLNQQKYILNRKEEQVKGQLTIIIRQLIQSLDQLHKKYHTFFTTNMQIMACVITYSAYMMECISIIGKFYQSYEHMISESQFSCVFYLLPAVMSQSRSLAEKNKELVFEGFDNISLIETSLVTTNMVRLSLLHKNMIENIETDGSKIISAINKHEIKKDVIVLQNNAQIIDKLIQELNNTTAFDVNKMHCLNALLSSHPKQKNNVNQYESDFCQIHNMRKTICPPKPTINQKNIHYQYLMTQTDSMDNPFFCQNYAQDTTKCTNNTRHNYDQNIMIHNLYPSLKKQKNSVELYTDYCADENRINLINVVGLQLIPDITDQVHLLKIPYWFTFEELPVLVPK